MVFETRAVTDELLLTEKGVHVCNKPQSGSGTETFRSLRFCMSAKWQ